MRRLFTFSIAGIVLILAIFGAIKWTASCSSFASKRALKSLSSSELSTLEVFFRTLLNDSQCGYVIYGNKPICIEGILSRDNNLLMYGEEFHKREVIIKKGLQIWRNLGNSQKDYIIHAYKKQSW